MKFQASYIESFPDVIDENNELLHIHDRTVCICFLDEDGVTIADISLNLYAASRFANELLRNIEEATLAGKD